MKIGQFLSVNSLALIFYRKKFVFTGSKLFYSIGIYRPCIYRKIPVNTGKMCFIAFILKTTGSCKFFLLQDPVITEPCIFIALGSGVGMGTGYVSQFLFSKKSC